MTATMSTTLARTLVGVIEHEDRNVTEVEVAAGIEVGTLDLAMLGEPLLVDHAWRVATAVGWSLADVLERAAERRSSRRTDRYDVVTLQSYSDEQVKLIDEVEHGYPEGTALGNVVADWAFELAELR